MQYATLAPALLLILCSACSSGSEAPALSGLELDASDDTTPTELRVRADGPLDAKVIARISRAHGNELRVCHERALEEDADASGLVVAHYSVSADGDAVDVELVTDEVGSVEASACFIDALERWRFPSAGQATRVVFPFRLVAVR